LDLHQLDSYERFHQLILNSPFPSLAWRDRSRLLARNHGRSRCGLLVVVALGGIYLRAVTWRIARMMLFHRHSLLQIECITLTFLDPIKRMILKNAVD
jgi:hypothetical protein